MLALHTEKRNVKEFKETCSKNRITFASDVELSYVLSTVTSMI